MCDGMVIARSGSSWHSSRALNLTRTLSPQNSMAMCPVVSRFGPINANSVCIFWWFDSPSKGVSRGLVKFIWFFSANTYQYILMLSTFCTKWMRDHMNIVYVLFWIIILFYLQFTIGMKSLFENHINDFHSRDRIALFIRGEEIFPLYVIFAFTTQD